MAGLLLPVAACAVEPPATTGGSPAHNAPAPRVEPTADPPSPAPDVAEPAARVRLRSVEDGKRSWRFVELDVTFANDTDAPAWFLLRTFRSSPAVEDGNTVRRSGDLALWHHSLADVNTRELAPATRLLAICDANDCDEAVFLAPGERLTHENIEDDVEADEGSLVAEIWRLSALRFDGVPAETWLDEAELPRLAQPVMTVRSRWPPRPVETRRHGRPRLASVDMVLAGRSGFLLDIEAHLQQHRRR